MKYIGSLFIAFIFALATMIPTHAKSSVNNAQWNLSRVSAQYSWSLGGTGKGVSILVIDTGLDKIEATTVLSGSILPSFSANPLHVQITVQCPRYKNGALVTPYPVGEPCFKTILEPNKSPFRDSIGHGSFVVSEIVGHGAPYHFYGIAPQAKVAMGSVFYKVGADSRDVAAAIRWGVINKFPIISMSLGSANDDSVLASAVKFAIAHNVLVVAASGNDSNATADYPGAYPGVIAVGSSGKWDNIADYSNGGTSIVAPGDFVFGIAPEHPTYIGCGGLCQWEGTSMATPFVAGALADLMSLGLNTAQAKTALLTGARREKGWNSTYYGNGILDLRGSIGYAKKMHWIN